MSGAKKHGRGSQGGLGQRGCRGSRDAKNANTKWVSITKLNRLVKDDQIKTLEEIYISSLQIKETEIIEFFFFSIPSAEPRRMMS